MAAAGPQTEAAPPAAQTGTRRVTYTSYEVNSWEATFEQSGGPAWRRRNCGCRVVLDGVLDWCCLRRHPSFSCAQGFDPLPRPAAGVTVLVDPWLVGELTFGGVRIWFLSLLYSSIALLPCADACPDLHTVVWWLPGTLADMTGIADWFR